MADIRIKDLTTTASSTASDDFIAVDGATNGTRKLNAYSPSFGGSATVAGTLAVTKSNGGNTTGAANAAISLPTDESTIQGPGTYTQIRMGGNLVLGSSNETLIQVNQVNAIRINSSQQVQVPTTTASTSTSTGALVVSGGVGVAGALYVGSKGQFQSNDDALSLKYSTDGGACLLAWKNTSGTTLWSIGGGIDTRQDELVFRRGSTTVLNLNNSNNATFAGTLTVSAGSLVVDHVGSSSPTLSLSANGSVQSRFFANGSNTFLESYTNTPLILRTNQTTALTITTGQQVQVNATTASTSTSTGALVVSGGVGVAKDLYVGGTVITLQPGSGTTAPQQKIIGPSGATYGPSLFLDASASTSGKVYIVGSGLSGDNGGLGSFYVYDVSAGTSVLKIVGGNTTLAGNITTAAPAGGTAAAWKLGTVASVSPTSPNRTIEVDIGGTIYYIHAKTTNN